jgi:hypothetical protein
MEEIKGIIDNIKKQSPEKVVTDSQYLNLMNFYSTREIEQKRIRSLCNKFNVTFVRGLPRSKYKEAMEYLKSGEWNK